MEKKLFVGLFLILLIISVSLFPARVEAWGEDIHDYLCPVEFQAVSTGCRIADSREFQKNYPFAEVMNHLCLDNKPDCPPRLVAKYYVKKYYFEGKKDLNLLAGAAHLIQDSYVPDHWYPMRSFFGRIFVPFAPRWVGTTEGLVSEQLSRRQTNWSIHGVNQAYLEDIKEKVVELTSHEPTEGLGQLENQIRNRSFWQKVRSYKEWVYIPIIIITPFLIYEIFKARKSGKINSDLLITAITEGIFVILLMAICFGY